MGTPFYPTVPVAQPEAEPWPIDEHTIRVDEMFARRLDTAAGVRLDPRVGEPAAGRDYLPDNENHRKGLRGEYGLANGPPAESQRISPDGRTWS